MNEFEVGEMSVHKGDVVGLLSLPGRVSYLLCGYHDVILIQVVATGFVNAFAHRKRIRGASLKVGFRETEASASSGRA